MIARTPPRGPRLHQQRATFSFAKKKSAISAFSPLLLGYGCVRIGEQFLIFCLFLRGEGRPEGGGAARGRFAVAAGCVEEHQLLESGSNE
jgi:hypothetical protein